MGSKKKRKPATPAEDQSAKRTSSQQRRNGDTAASPLAWSADGVTVTLPAVQALLLIGRASLEVQSGEVATSGCTFTTASGPVEVCADERWGGAIVLEPGASLGAVPLAASCTASFTLSRAPGSSRQGLGPPGAPLARQFTQQAQQQQQVQQDPNGIGEVGSGGIPLGFKIWLANDPSAPAAGAGPLPPLWQQAAGEVEASMAQQAQQGGGPPVIVVCGAKKVGKSTFARFLVNSLLSKHACVAYLDTDCGQPEFTAPGLVSLSLVRQPVLGPPHMHLRRPDAAFFTGDTSPASDPARYLQYIQELYRWYCQRATPAAPGAGTAAHAAAAGQMEQQPLLPPLVVNTHGWVKGMGYDVLVELLQSLPVSHFVQIAAANPKKNLPPGAFWLNSAQQQQPAQWLLPGLGGDVTAPQPAMSETSARSAAALGPAASDGTLAGGGGKGRLNAVEQRALQWEALAQQCIEQSRLEAATTVPSGSDAGGGGGSLGPASEIGDCLAAAVPYEVDFDSLEVQVLHSSVPASQLYYALNGAVVGLCSAAAPQQTSSTLPAPLPCLGLGIVRAADAKRRRLYILTAVPQAELESVAVLQLGRLELPASLLQTGAFLSPYLCLHSLSSMGTGAGAIKSRNNLVRQSQF